VGQLTRTVEIELLTRSQDADHDLTDRLAKVLLLPDEPVTMKRILVDGPELPELALRANGLVYPVARTRMKQRCSSCCTTC